MKEINKLLKIRKKLYKKYEKADKKEVEKVYGRKLDDNRNLIINLIKNNFKELDSEFIIITLTHLGIALNVIYDDNGYFAIIGNSFPTIYDNSKLSGVYDVYISEDKKQWKKSIKSALKYYIKKFENL